MEPSAAADYLAKLEQFEQRQEESAAAILRSKSYLVLPWANELIRLPAVLDAVESLFGPNIYCYSMSFFIKNAGSPGFVAWHQDAPLGGASVANRMLTAWVALSPSRLENGCMEVVEGSHTQMHRHVPSAGSNLLSNSQEIAVDVDPGNVTAIELLPGQFSFHHGMIVHGSAANNSAIRRVGFAIRYTVPFDRGEPSTETAMLVRGTDPYGCFVQERSPLAEMEPEAMAYREGLVKRLRKAKGMVGY
jgi:ectoine hydroxylase-related dioxygenase (phytanoyl-CoA dioxygenase family)